MRRRPKIWETFWMWSWSSISCISVTDFVLLEFGAFGTSSKIMNSNVEITLAAHTGEYENGSLAKSSFSLCRNAGWGGWTTSRNKIEGVAWTVFFSDIFLNGENTDISVMHIFRLNKRTSAQNIDRLPVVETSSWRKIRHDESRTDLVGNFCFWSFTLESEFLFI